MGATAHLLELQRLDLAIDRLRSRISTLTSGSELTSAVTDADAAEARLGEIKLQLDALDRDTAKLEHDVDSLSQKAAAEEQRMSSGSVANARELEAIGHEVQNLRRRIADREDEELAIMERRETLAAAEKEATAEATTLRETAGRLRAAAGDELSTAEAELAARQAERPVRGRRRRSRGARALRRAPPAEEGRGRGGARGRRVPGVPRAAVGRRAVEDPAHRRGPALRVLPADLGPVTDAAAPRDRELRRRRPRQPRAGRRRRDRRERTRATCSPRSPKGSGRRRTTSPSTPRRSVGSRRPNVWAPARCCFGPTACSSCASSPASTA